MLKEELNNFTGTEHHFAHWSGMLKYTDGITYLQQEGGCYWLIDAIASYQLNWQTVPFQVWTLKAKDSKGILTMKEDTGMPELVKQEIPYTDFPMEEVQVWVIDGVCILPSEY